MVAAYENDLMRKIREEYGTNGTTVEGASEVTGALQSQLRFGFSESGQSGGNTANSGTGSEASDNGIPTTQRASKGSHRGKRRTSTAVNQDNGGVDSSNGSDNDAVSTATIREKIYQILDSNPRTKEAELQRLAGCARTTARKYMDLWKVERGYEDIEEEPEKPSGIDARPNSIERKIRQEQEAATAASSNESRKKNIFAGLLGNNRGKTGGKEKEQARSKGFSEREADEIRPALIAAMLDYFRYADEFIYATHKAHQQVSIWSSIDDEECGMLADAWLSMAKTSPKAAQHVVNVVNSHHKLRVGLILLPRFYQTFQIYAANGIGVRDVQ